jgi:hypothetical protein
VRKLFFCRLPVLGIVLLIGAGHACAEPISPTSWTAFVKAHCYDCHSGDEPEGGLDLARLGVDLNDAELLRRWVRIHDRVAGGEMPPKEAPRPNEQAKRQFLSSLGDSLTRADAAIRHTVIRRLNRIEYENTVRDLFGIRVDVKEMLPEDPSAHGFDTIGDVLAISPEQMEVYLQAAEKALDQVFGADREPKRVDVRKPLGQDEFASRSIGRLFKKTDDDSLIAFQGGWCPSVFNSGQATVDGTYRVRIEAKTYQTDKPLVMAVYGGDVIVGRAPSHLVGYYDVAPGDDWTVVEFEDFLLARGAYQMKPYQLHAPSQGPDQFKGPGLMIGRVEVVGPLEPWPPPSRAKLLGDVDPKQATAEDARQIFARLLPRAFRRPIEADEVETYVSLTAAALDQGRPFIAALRFGLQAILCSPEFLFREEPAAAVATSGSKTISQHALATRLSYFLWSSMPDDELLLLAVAGKLSQPEILREQVERMLRDPKSSRFVENFTGQWLDLRDIDFTEPDMRQYPEFDEMLRYSILEETHRYFREVLDNDLPLTDFVDSNWAILNERLAKHYGIEGVTGQKFRRVSLPSDSVRGGVMTQAAVLKVTANGTNTSPVVRGVWVLENIIGQSVPPPPPGIGAIEPDIRGATTIREQLQKHRNVQSCAACHRHIDPPGFALESFDAIGGWRDWYRSIGEGQPVNLEINRRRVQYRKGPIVDSSGQFADGREFSDIREFKNLMLSDREQIARCLTEKLLTYATGRGLGFSDRPAVSAIVAKASEHQYGFRSLIHEIVQSEVFRCK